MGLKCSLYGWEGPWETVGSGQTEGRVEGAPQTGEVAQAKAQAWKPSRRVANPDCWEHRVRGGCQQRPKVAAVGGESLWGALKVRDVGI